MIAVTIPAHNEADLIGKCLQSILVAAAHPHLVGERVEIHVALDRCSDGTGAIARAHGARTVATSGGVGIARAAAASAAIARGARWLAFTDADTCVPPDWLSAQLDCAADVFCGVVEVTDWHDFRPETRQAFLSKEIRRDGHPHVHGANLGMSVAAYVAAGGFLRSSAAKTWRWSRHWSARACRLPAWSSRSSIPAPAASPVRPADSATTWLDWRWPYWQASRY